MAGGEDKDTIPDLELPEDIADLLITNAREVVTCAGFSVRPARGADQGSLGVVSDAAVVVRGDRIVAVGSRQRLERTTRARRVLDARGGVVLPGFVDAHTHLVFAGDRVDEWQERLSGKSYLEIQQAGGGILRTVRATRAARLPALLANGEHWCRVCLQHGTTTLEIKSGYALDDTGEIKLLRVIQELAESSPQDIVATYLGAHLVPPEYLNRRQEYIELILATQARVAELQLAEFVDVFCERGAFSLAETERLLVAAQALGFGLKIHAEQFTSMGAAALAAKLGACSVDHLEQVDEAGLEALARAPEPPIAVLLPCAAFHLGLAEGAPARRLVEAGVPIALATDFNPGTAPSPSLPMAIALGSRSLGLSVAECIVASTINAAHALRRGATTGSLEPGKRADLVICDVPDHRWLGYAFGFNPVRQVIAGGRVVVEN
jgi:imidazolonepropionase